MVVLKHDKLVATEEFSINAIANKVARLNFEKNKRGTGWVEIQSAAAAPENHSYPMNDFKSRKKPPRPCSMAPSGSDRIGSGSESADF
jgi:hypothetical protein